MTEADLARPLVEVRDFFTDELEYEIYTYGEENVIIPVKHVQKYAAEAAEGLREKVLEALKRFDESVEVEVVGGNKVVAYVDRDVMPRIIGRKGETISRLEKELGVSIDVMPHVVSLGREIEFNVKESGATVNIEVGEEYAGRRVNIYVDNEYLFSATVGRKGVIAVRKKSDHGKTIIKYISAGKALKIILAD
jgi:ATPase